MEKNRGIASGVLFGADGDEVSHDDTYGPSCETLGFLGSLGSSSNPSN